MKTVQGSLIDELLQLEATKTWSLIVTVFGDHKGDLLAAKELRELLKPLGVKPEALRVALHRLKVDGWIASKRVGREVSYRLTEYGRRETVLAQADVYREDFKYPEGWQLVLTRADTKRLSEPCIQINKTVFLAPARFAAQSDHLNTALPADIPEWFSAHLVSDQLLEHSVQLTQIAERFLAMSKMDESAKPFRILFVHYWRKLALRDTVWAHISLYPNGPMALCHRTMLKVFKATDRLTLGQRDKAMHEGS